MSNQEIIDELLLTLKQIRSEAEGPNADLLKIHQKADEGINIVEKH